VFNFSLINADIIHDVDQDNIGSNIDNCPEVYNPDQLDTDEDGIGNLCDNSPGIEILGPVIIIENNETEPDEDTSSKSSGSASHNIRYLDINFCEPNWKCGSWSKCNDGVMKRLCYDINKCGFVYNKPYEKTGCQEEIISKSLIQKNNNIGLWVSLLLSLILIAILILLVNRKS